MRGRAGAVNANLGRRVAGVIVALGYAASLTANLPGHFPPDALWQLAQGREGVFNPWHPPIMAWLLGLADRIGPAAWPFAALDAAIFYGALFAFVALERRPRPAALVVLAVSMAAPIVLIEQGVVLKDVLFANAALAGFAALAWAGHEWASPMRRRWLLALAGTLFSLAVLARQNGALAAGFGVVAVAAMAWVCAPADAPGRPGRRAGPLDAGLLALVILAVTGAATLALDTRLDGGPGGAQQVRVMQAFDLAGALRRDPALPLPVLDAGQPGLATFLRREAAPRYRAAGINALYGAPGGKTIMLEAGPEVSRQWSWLILHRPDLYLATRAEVFGDTLTTPERLECPMIIVGVDAGDADMLRDAGLTARQSARDDWDGDYAAAFLATPLYSHLFYAALSLVALAWSGWRWRLGERSGGLVASTAMLMAGLAYSLSFFVLSIACDYRYLYFLDVTALAAILRLAASRPPLRRSSP